MKIMKWLGIGSIAITLVLSSLLVACQSSEPEPAATPAPSPAPQPEPEKEVITLQVECMTGEVGGGADHIRWFLNEIEMRSEGRIKCEDYWLGSLVPSGHMVEGIAAGTADLGYINVSGEYGRLPLLSIAELPGFSADSRVLSRASWEIAQTSALKEEFAKNNIIYVVNVPSEVMSVFSNKPTFSLDDIKGQKLLGLGTGAKVGAALGASIVTMPPPEARSSGEKGVIDGIIFPMGACARAPFNLHEWLEYYYEIPGNTPSFTWALNADTFNSLPADLQEIFTGDLIQDYEQIAYLNHTLRDSYKGVQLWIDAGHTITLPTPEDQAKMEELLQPLHQEWVKEKEDNGLPGQEVYDAWSKAVKKYAAFYTYPRTGS